MNFSESQFDGGSQTADFPAPTVAVIGMVSRIVKRDLDVTTFTLYDGTGELNCKGWLNEQYDRLQMEEIIREGFYVHVDGYLKSFKGEKYVAVFSVRRVTNSDESILPFIASVLTYEHQKKIQGDGENMNYTPKTPIQNNGTKNVFMSTQSSEVS
ncbi:hypothetical protein SSX86_012715 [Deinandra increscens subsp. villosa]|uniref:OB domain-containing protein n=1 Tax=Deinandra increscens subsp. villosa TaxID=3103831 RepID=A0AAP0D944_9ASTR